MSAYIPSFAPTAAEREAEREHQEQAWRRVFQPLDDSLYNVNQPWLVHNWIPLGTLAILASPPKQGKTALATALALAVATGTSFAGMPCTQGGVLWMAQEESYWDRQRLLRQSPHTDPLVPLFTTFERLPIDQQDTLDLLSFWVQETSAKLIVIDPLHGATSGRSLTDGWQARKTLDLLRAFCHSHNVTALVLHHSKRAASPSGYLRVAENDQLAATAGMTMVLSTRMLSSGSPRPSVGEGLGVRVRTSHQNPHQRPSSGFGEVITNGSRVVTLDCAGRGPFANRRLQFLSSAPLDYVLDEPLTEETPTLPNRITYAHRVKDLLVKNGRLTSGQMLAKLDLPENSLRVALARLVRTGALTITTQPDGTRVYELKQSANEELMGS